MPSKIFGPTDSVADTLTQIGSAYQVTIAAMIYAIRIGKGNVVNAAGNAGFVHIETSERSYDFAYGNGSGGATNSNNTAAEVIECAINVEKNTNISVYVLDATAAKDVTVSVQYKEGGGSNSFRTMAAGGVSANGDLAADTEESFSVSSKLLRASLTPAVNGKIRQIRYAGSGVVDAKANSALIKILVPNVSGPFEFAVGSGAGGAATSSASPADVINFPEGDGIPVAANAVIDIKITSAEIVKFPHISLSYW